MSNATFAERLQTAMNLRNLKSSQIEKISEQLFNEGKIKKVIKMPLITDYLKGRYEAKQSNIYALSLILNVDEGWLMGANIPMEKTSKNTKNKLLKLNEYMEKNNLDKISLIPIYDNIVIKTNWKENPIGYTPFDAKIQGCPEDREYFYYKISDNSMNIEKNTYILIEDTTNVNINDIILYSLNNKIELGIYKLNLQQKKNFIILGKYIK